MELVRSNTLIGGEFHIDISQDQDKDQRNKHSGGFNGSTPRLVSPQSTSVQRCPS